MELGDTLIADGLTGNAAGFATSVRAGNIAGSITDNSVRTATSQLMSDSCTRIRVCGLNALMPCLEQLNTHFATVSNACERKDNHNITSLQ